MQSDKAESAFCFGCQLFPIVTALPSIVKMIVVFNRSYGAHIHIFLAMTTVCLNFREFRGHRGAMLTTFT